MGSGFVFVGIEETDREVVKQKFAELCEQSRYEDGASYSGEIGMFHSIAKWVPGNRTVNEAYEYLEEHHNKWDEAMAVQCDKGWMVGGWVSS